MQGTETFAARCFYLRPLFFSTYFSKNILTKTGGWGILETRSPPTRLRALVVLERVYGGMGWATSCQLGVLVTRVRISDPPLNNFPRQQAIREKVFFHRAAVV